MKKVNGTRDAICNKKSNITFADIIKFHFTHKHTITIRLDSVEKLKKFSVICSKSLKGIIIRYRHKYINGHNVYLIYSKPIKIMIHKDDWTNKNLMESLKQFLYKS